MSNELSTEERILRLMKKILTDIAKETFTKPGFTHPLSDGTITNIRDCLSLITSREVELRGESEARPRFIDEPKKSVVVPINEIKTRREDEE